MTDSLGCGQFYGLPLQIGKAMVRMLNETPL